MLKDIVAVSASATFHLHLRFDDGVEGDVDVAAEIPFAGVFAPLTDPEFFVRVRVDPEIGTIVWPNGADLDPEVLCARITGNALPKEPGAAA
ncbi:MAG: DUF2442 domain-containing protein [Deltaproteobacteria bacterium]